MTFTGYRHWLLNAVACGAEMCPRMETLLALSVSFLWRSKYAASSWLVFQSLAEVRLPAGRYGHLWHFSAVSSSRFGPLPYWPYMFDDDVVQFSSRPNSVDLVLNTSCCRHDPGVVAKSAMSALLHRSIVTSVTLRLRSLQTRWPVTLRAPIVGLPGYCKCYCVRCVFRAVLQGSSDVCAQHRDLEWSNTPSSHEVIRWQVCADDVLLLRTILLEQPADSMGLTSPWLGSFMHRVRQLGQIGVPSTEVKGGESERFEYLKTSNPHWGHPSSIRYPTIPKSSFPVGILYPRDF